MAHEKTERAKPDLDGIPRLKAMSGQEIPFSDIIKIDPDCLWDEYQEHAAWQATISFAHLRAKMAADLWEQRIMASRAEAEIYQRSHMEKQMGIKPTKDAVEAVIEIDPKISKMQEKLLSLRFDEDALRIARDAFYARKEMLISMGATERLDQKHA